MRLEQEAIKTKNAPFATVFAHVRHAQSREDAFYMVTALSGHYTGALVHVHCTLSRSTIAGKQKRWSGEPPKVPVFQRGEGTRSI